MIIVAGGDSFIFGSELSDKIPSLRDKNWSRRTFTSLLAGMSKMHYECVAWPGNANQAITRQTMEYCESHKDIDKFVIISWTFPNRYEFRFPFTTPNKNTNWESISSWSIADFSDIEQSLESTPAEEIKRIETYKQKLDKSGVADFAKTYFKYVGTNEYWEIYTSLQSIVMMQNYLDLHKIPYMFTMADNCIFENHTILSREQSIEALFRQINFDNWFMFPGSKGFYQWAMENKYPIGVTHPLDEAHADAAQLMKSKLHELVAKFNK